nr:HAD-IIIA family hydrolase [Allonocardiopsis opalescens]
MEAAEVPGPPNGPQPPPTDYTVVIPTVGRASLGETLAALLGPAAPDGHAPREILVVDDRPDPAEPLDVDVEQDDSEDTDVKTVVRILRSGGRGPAAARNTGWRAARSTWVAFLDDDVVPAPGWGRALAADLDGLSGRGGTDGDVAGSQGRIVVPEPADRAPTDAERATLALADAHWITADMAVRRTALAAVGGFDERFRRAYREDTDLALRLWDAGYRLRLGERVTVHPSRGGDWATSLRSQRGNADDALMRRRHGPGWRGRVGEPHGRLGRHAAATTALGLALLLGGTALGVRRGRRRWAVPAGAAALTWAGLTAEFVWARVAPGPKTPAEIGAMALTSVLIPPLACAHRLAGEWRHRGVQPALPRPLPAAERAGPAGGPAAVLFDRDGTLVYDVPYNGDPVLVEPVPGARTALDRLRGLGVPVGVVTNQSGVARGLITREQVDAVNARIEELLGPFDVWRVCAHGEGDGCACRKPHPGMIRSAADALGVPAAECVVIGDTGGDVGAALAAGARAILVPNEVTRAEETDTAPEVAADLADAVERALRGWER